MVELRSSGEAKVAVHTWVFLAEPVVGAVGGLTCLSVRCLSSYLIFPPVSVTSKPRSGSPARGFMDVCAVLNLSRSI